MLSKKDLIGKFFVKNSEYVGKGIEAPIYMIDSLSDLFGYKYYVIFIVDRTNDTPQVTWSPYRINEAEVVQNFENGEWLLLVSEKQFEWIKLLDTTAVYKTEFTTNEMTLLFLLRVRSLPWYTLDERIRLNIIRKKFGYVK